VSRGRAGVDISGALIDVTADLAISLESVQTGALKATGSVETSGILVAVVHTQGTLVDVETIHTVAAKASIASAREATLGVAASGVDITIISADFTLVNLMAVDAVTEETGLALAHERALLVNAISIDRAHIVTGKTFIDIIALMTVALETGDAVAEETLVGVDTSGVFITSVCAKCTLVWISCGCSCGSGRCGGCGNDSTLGWCNSRLSGWFLDWFGSAWLGESPDEIEAIEVSTLVRFELDHDQV